MKPRLGRHPALPLALVCLLFLGQAPFILAQGGPSRDLSIIVATDIHFLAPGLHDEGRAFSDFIASGDGKDLEHIDSILEAFLTEVEVAHPRALILTGDLTLNGEKASHLALAARLSQVEATGVQVLVLPGNHDINNPWARAFQGPSQLRTPYISPKDFESIYRDSGYFQALSRDREGLSYVAQIAPGLRILMLDSCLYEYNQAMGGPETGGRLSKETLGWVEAQAAKAKAEGSIILAALHHSLLDHSSVIQEGYTLSNGEEVALLLARLGIGLALTGHVHIQDVTARDLPGGRLYDIATNALSVSPNQYGVLEWKPGARSLEYHTRRVDVAAWARARGLKDPYLLDFQGASEKAFAARAVGLLSKALARDQGLSPQDAALAAKTLGNLNLRYFAGREGDNVKDPSLEESLGILSALPSPFLARYVRSILSDDGVDDNDLTIPVPAGR